MSSLWRVPAAHTAFDIISDSQAVVGEEDGLLNCQEHGGAAPYLENSDREIFYLIHLEAVDTKNLDN